MLSRGIFLIILFYPVVCFSKQFRSKIIFVKEFRNSYQGIFLTKGRALYPYPIKNDGVNQMMAKRLAIYDAMIHMSKDIVLIKPFLEKSFQPYIDEFFVRNTCLCECQNFDNDVLVSLEFIFVCDKLSYLAIKKIVKNQIEVEHKKKKKNQSQSPLVTNFFRDHKKHSEWISKPYWDQLVQFHAQMSDDDD